MSSKIREFSQDYKERCFNAWYITDVPLLVQEILKVIPSDDIGRKPSRRSLLNWIEQECWRDRKAALDAKAIEKVSENMIMEKAEIFKQQYLDAVTIANKAKDKLIQEGFDSSSSAVTAYFKATQEQRDVIGISDFFEKVSHMTEEELKKAITDMASKNEVVDAEQIVE